MDSLHYAKELIAFESTSALSNVAVSDYVDQTLREIGFETERIEYDDARGVRKVNMIGKKGEGTGGVAYFGHTDVVPADSWSGSGQGFGSGQESRDEHGPFEPTVVGEKLYGRGSCDMKGSVACMIAAAEEFAASELTAPIYITCTADEEIGYLGAREVVERSALYREMVAGNARGIIGEPTRLNVVHAHKGTYGFRVISRGIAAHSSTREGRNANLAMIPFLAEMKKIHDETETDPRWQNSDFDPPTMSWNIGINDHTAAINITPPQSICTVYFRPMPGQEPQELIDRARHAAEQNGLEFDLRAQAGPMSVDPDSSFVREMLELTGKERAGTVCYGTDGAMFTGLKQRVVFGPGDIAQAHTHDEWIALDQLRRGSEAYATLIRRWCC